MPVSLSAPWRQFLHPTILEVERTYPMWDALYDSKSQLRYADQPAVRDSWQAFVDFYDAGYLPDGFFGLTVEQQRALVGPAARGDDLRWPLDVARLRPEDAGGRVSNTACCRCHRRSPTHRGPYAPPALDCFAINRSTKLPDQSLTFLKFLASPPIQAWMTDNWRNISISPGITYTEPETAMFAKTLEKNLLFKSLASAYGNEVGTTFDAQFEPLANGQITIDEALAEIQNKIDVSPLKNA